MCGACSLFLPWFLGPGISGLGVYVCIYRYILTDLCTVLVFGPSISVLTDSMSLSGMCSGLFPVVVFTITSYSRSQ